MRNEGKTIHVGLKVTPEFQEQLRAMAKATKTSVSRLCVEILDTVINYQGKQEVKRMHQAYAESTNMMLCAQGILKQGERLAKEREKLGVLLRQTEAIYQREKANNILKEFDSIKKEYAKTKA